MQPNMSETFDAVLVLQFCKLHEYMRFQKYQ